MTQTQVLVVEDENIIAMELKIRLLKLGYSVMGPVSSGEETLLTIATAPPDLVLMDIRLNSPMGGIETAEQIRRQFDIPVIFVTAYADEHTLKQARLAEPFGYLIKPIEDKELHTTIEIALYKHQMERKLKDREQWLSAILNSTREGVITTDVINSITFMNPVAEQLTGWKYEEAMGQNLKQVFQVIRQKTIPVEPGTLQIPTPSYLADQPMLKIKGGSEIPIESSWADIIDHKGHKIGNVIVFRDVTERNRMEQALHENEIRYRRLAAENAQLLEQTRHDAQIKATLLAEVNHRIKNNLAAIISLLYLEQNRFKEKNHLDYAAAMTDLINRVQSLALIHRLLSKTGGASLRLDDLTNEVIQMILPALPFDKKLIVEVQPSPIRIPAHQVNDLALIINEITTNTIKHVSLTDQTARIKIRIGLTQEQDILYEFRDNGPGYPPLVLAQGPTNGGLALIKNIVEVSLSGQVKFQNDHGALIMIQFKSEALGGIIEDFASTAP